MDISELILDQHNQQRRLFAFIQEIDPDDHQSLSAVWDRLSGFLDTHAEGEELHFYPRLLKRGTGGGDADSAKGETKDAIKDHNEIRDSVKKVAGHSVGSDDWFKAVAEANVVNSKHMSEEERQALADFRCSTSVEERHGLGVKFLAYVSRHLSGVKPVDKDPADYVEEHQA